MKVPTQRYGPGPAYPASAHPEVVRPVYAYGDPYYYGAHPYYYDYRWAPRTAAHVPVAPPTRGPPAPPPAPQPVVPSAEPERPSTSGSYRSESVTSVSEEEKPRAAPKYVRPMKLRNVHKLAERRRRKEMSELFTQLRDMLHFDPSVKTSQWDILSATVKKVESLGEELEVLRREKESVAAGRNDNGEGLEVLRQEKESIAAGRNDNVPVTDAPE